jgi:hypothetical protein
VTAFSQQPGNFLQRRIVERRAIVGERLFYINKKISG